MQRDEGVAKQKKTGTKYSFPFPCFRGGFCLPPINFQFLFVCTLREGREHSIAKQRRTHKPKRKSTPFSSLFPRSADRRRRDDVKNEDGNHSVRKNK